MRILSFSDWRVQSLDALVDYLEELEPKPDIITYSGDDINRFNPPPILQDFISSDNTESPSGQIEIELENMPPCFRYHLTNLQSGVNLPHPARFFLTTFLTALGLNSKQIMQLYATAPDFRESVTRYQVEHITGKISGTEYDSPSCKPLISQGVCPGGDDICQEITHPIGYLRAGKSHQPIMMKFIQSSDNFFEKLASFSKYGLIAVIGNDDGLAAKKAIKGEKVIDVHEQPVVIDDYVFIGQESASREAGMALGSPLYSEEEISSHLIKSASKYKGKKIILVSHSPPYGVLDRAIRHSPGESIGSRAIRKFIDENPVRLNLCGHVHSQGGKIERITNGGICTVVNIASHDSPGSTGKLAIIDIEKGSLRIELSSVTPMGKIYGIGPVRAARLAESGITKLEHLADGNPEVITKMTGFSSHVIERWCKHAHAILNNAVELTEPIDVAGESYIDIETNLQQDVIWMIAVLHEGETKQFFSDDAKNERKMLQEFLDFLEDITCKVLYSYSGTHFELRTIRQCLLKNELDVSRLSEVKDLLLQVRSNLITPLSGYGLKELSRLFGFSWRHPAISGIDAPYHYDSYIKTKDESILIMLKEYNEDDVLSVAHLVRCFRAMEIGKKYDSKEILDLCGS